MSRLGATAARLDEGTCARAHRYDAPADVPPPRRTRKRSQSTRRTSRRNLHVRASSAANLAPCTRPSRPHRRRSGSPRPRRRPDTHPAPARSVEDGARDSHPTTMCRATTPHDSIMRPIRCPVCPDLVRRSLSSVLPHRLMQIPDVLSATASPDLALPATFVLPNAAAFNQPTLPYSSEMSSMSGAAAPYPPFMHTPEIAPSITPGGLRDSPFNEQPEPYIQYYFEHVRKIQFPLAGNDLTKTLGFVRASIAMIVLHDVTEILLFFCVRRILDSAGRPAGPARVRHLCPRESALVARHRSADGRGGGPGAVRRPAVL